MELYWNLKSCKPNSENTPKQSYFLTHLKPYTNLSSQIKNPPIKYEKVLIIFILNCLYHKIRETIFNRFFFKILAYIYSPTWSHAVPSTQQSLTSVFGMGTGVPSAQYTPRYWRKILLWMLYKYVSRVLLSILLFIFEKYCKYFCLPSSRLGSYQHWNIIWNYFSIWFQLKKRTKSVYKYRSCY